MKLSTKVRYGLRAMIDLAVHYDDEPVTLSSIAKREDISEKYLEQVMMPLKKSELVRTVRGSQGGFVLNKDPEKITVGAIVRAVEGPLAIVDCVHEINPILCSHGDQCVTRIVWEKVNKAVAQTIDSITLQNLAAEYEDNSNCSISTINC